MRKQSFMLLLLLPLVWAAAACDPGGAPPSTPGPGAQLEEAERVWAGQGIAGYRIEVLVVNSVWHAQSQEIVVQDGVVVESAARCTPAPMEAGECQVWAFTAEGYTVPGLFAQARSQIEDPEAAPWIEVEYDPRYGFPRRISFDNPGVVDEDWTWRVLEFNVEK